METITMILPPRTIREVWDNLPEGTRAQIIENHLIMSAAPLDRHQKVLNKIIRPLLNYTGDNPVGEIRIAPSSVFLDDENIFEPDIMFFSNKNLHKINTNGIHGTPDLVIEILSPSTARYDQNQKKSAYESYGVTEYWIVDPETKEVEGFFLEDDTYGSPRKFFGKINSSVLNHEFEF